MKKFRVRLWLKQNKKKVVILKTADVQRLGTERIIKIVRTASKKKIATNIVTQRLEDFLNV